MHPILFVLELGGGQRPVASFGVMLALGMIMGAALVVRGASRAGIDGADALAIVSIVACAGLFGGYVMQVVVETFRGASLASAAAAGGLTFYGAPVMGIAALVLATRVLGVPFGRFCDVSVGAVPLVHALGRIGCFFAGCCYGSPYEGPLAITITHPLSYASLDPVPRHPVQLYEAGMLFVLAFAFAVVPAAKVGDGRRALAYAGAYAVVRLIAERFRGDAERGFVVGSVSTSDAISLVVLVAALCGMALVKRRARA